MSHYRLAVSYLKDGRIQEAIVVIDHVVDVQSALLEADDPFRLNSIELQEKAHRMGVGAFHTV